jgi:hypothetical protein
MNWVSFLIGAVLGYLAGASGLLRGLFNMGY